MLLLVISQNKKNAHNSWEVSSLWSVFPPLIKNISLVRLLRIKCTVFNVRLLETCASGTGVYGNCTLWSTYNGMPLNRIIIIIIIIIQDPGLFY